MVITCHKCDIYLKIHSSSIFNKFGRTPGRQFSLKSPLPFLYRRIISSSLSFPENFHVFIELVKLMQIKLLKISMSFFTIFFGISEFWVALLASSIKFPFSISFLISAKLKLSLFLHFYRMETMLGCFLNLKLSSKLDLFCNLLRVHHLNTLKYQDFLLYWKRKYFKPF